MRALLRPDPDRIALQLTDNIYRRCICSKGCIRIIARHIDVLAHEVQGTAVGDSLQFRQNVAAEFRAVLEVDLAALSQVDAGS